MRTIGVRALWLTILGLAAAACGGSEPGETLDAAVAVDAAVDDAALPGDDDGGGVDGATPRDGSIAADAGLGPLEACESSGGVVRFERGSVRIDYDLVRGTATYFHDGVARISDFYAGVDLDHYVTSRDYTARDCVRNAERMIVTHTASGLPVMEHELEIDAGGEHFLAQLTLRGSALATRWIAPIVMSTAGGVDLGSTGDTRVLWVPFDNDAWVSYNALPIDVSGTSHEVAAFYDNDTRRGLVVGSVTHDTWKTGVYYSGREHRLDALNVFGGATSEAWTHDALPHGLVRGDVVQSPRMFVAFGDDWRDLLESFADANARVQPRLAWSGGVPFGWNSWGKVQTRLSYDIATAVSDFVAQNLQTSDFESDGTVYVNLDSYWDNLSDEELGRFVEHCRARGQRAGIYWAPFVDWAGSEGRIVEGTEGTRYGEIWLRDGGGQPIRLDGAVAVDPTHPATRARIDHYIARFRAHGFEYLKLDFLTHGALESSVRADPRVQTGIQAYHQGMSHLLSRIEGTMFVSLSIAPLFPHQYGHARRVSCDVYGAASGDMSSRYVLNSVSYGWWASGRLYQHNDPDHLVFEGFSTGANMTRLLSGVVSGTVFLSGDDLSRPAGQALARAYLSNPRVNAVARLGRSFRPVEGNTGTGPSEVMVLRDGDTHYLAVFNFANETVTRSIDLARAGLDPSRDYAVTDLWTGTASSAHGTLSVSLAPELSRLYQLR